MSTILVLYGSEPPFPPTDQHPDASRYYMEIEGMFWVVDAIGEPTLAELRARLVAVGLLPP